MRRRVWKRKGGWEAGVGRVERARGGWCRIVFRIHLLFALQVVADAFDVRTKYFPSPSESLNDGQRLGEGHTGIVHQNIQRPSFCQKLLHTATDRGKDPNSILEVLKSSFSLHLKRGCLSELRPPFPCHVLT